MKTRAKVALLLLALVAFGAGTVQAQQAVTVDPAVLNLGYMNVLDLGSNYLWGSSWGLADLTAVYNGYELTLGPNTIGDPDEYWYQCPDGVTPPDCGGPGAPGNKIMEANSYAQVDDGSFAGQTVTFTGEVLSNSLTPDHTVVAFVKDYAPDFSSYQQSIVLLDAVGPFSVSLNTINDGARHVQWGFQMVGVNVWITDVAPFGEMVIGPDWTVSDEDSSWGTVKSLYR